MLDRAYGAVASLGAWRREKRPLQELAGSSGRPHCPVWGGNSQETSGESHGAKKHFQSLLTPKAGPE